MDLRSYFGLVCPYRYIIGREVQEAEYEGLMEVEWLPFELRPAPAALPRQHYPGGVAPVALPGSRRQYIRDRWRDRWRDRVYELARARPEPRGRDPRSPYQARYTLAPALHSFAEERGRGRAHGEAAHHAFFVAGQDLEDQGGLRGVARAAGLGEEAAETAWDPGRIFAPRSVCEEALGTGVHAVPTIATREEVL